MKLSQRLNRLERMLAAPVEDHRRWEEQRASGDPWVLLIDCLPAGQEQAMMAARPWNTCGTRLENADLQAWNPTPRVTNCFWTAACGHPPLHPDEGVLRLPQSAG